MSEFKQKHKDYLKANDIKNEYELASYLEILKSDARKLSQNERQMFFDLVWLMINKKDSLSSFFYAEKNTNSTRHKSINGETHGYTTTTTASVNDLVKEVITPLGKKVCSPQCFCDGSCKKEQKLPIEIPKPTAFNKSDKDDVITNSSRKEKEVIEYIQGVKETDGKLNYELDWEFIQQMAERMSQNKGKYEPYNWAKPMSVEKLKQSMFRHVIEVMKGNYSDDSRDFGHFESIALNAMMINYQLKNNN